MNNCLDITEKLKNRETKERFSVFKSFGFSVQRETKGFSLIELLIVISIIALIAAIIVPSFNAFNRRQTVKQAAKQFKADLRLAQNSAVSSVDNRGWGIDLVITSDSYRIRKFAKDELTGGWNLDGAAKIRSLPEGIVFSSATATRVIFERLTGIPVQQATGDPITNPILISVEWGTGAATTTETVTISTEGSIE